MLAELLYDDNFGQDFLIDGKHNVNFGPRESIPRGSEAPFKTRDGYVMQILWSESQGFFIMVHSPEFDERI